MLLIKDLSIKNVLLFATQEKLSCAELELLPGIYTCSGTVSKIESQYTLSFKNFSLLIYCCSDSI